MVSSTPSPCTQTSMTSSPSLMRCASSVHSIVGCLVIGSLPSSLLDVGSRAGGSVASVECPGALTGRRSGTREHVDGYADLGEVIRLLSDRRDLPYAPVR